MIAQTTIMPIDSEDINGDENEVEKTSEIHHQATMAQSGLSSADLSFALHSPIAPYLHYASKKSDALRKGKWTVEEERYTNKIIEAFNAGTIDLPETSSGITLRAYLSEKLGCDPMRITKKYTGTSCLGKRVYHCDVCKASPEVIEKVKTELAELEYKFKDKLEQTTREKRESELTVAGCDYQNHVISTPAIDAMMHGGWAYNMNMLSGMGLGLMGGPMGGPIPLGFPMHYMAHAYPQLSQIQTRAVTANITSDISTPTSLNDLALSSNSVRANDHASISTSSRFSLETAPSANATSQLYTIPQSVSGASRLQSNELNQESLKHLYPVFNHDAYMNLTCFNPSIYPGGVPMTYPYPLGLTVPPSHASLPIMGHKSHSDVSKQEKSSKNEPSALDNETLNSDGQSYSKECDNGRDPDCDSASDGCARKRSKSAHTIAQPGCTDGSTINGAVVDSSDATSSESSSGDEGRGQGQKQSVSEYSYSHRNKISSGNNKLPSLQVPTSCGPLASYHHSPNPTQLNGLNRLPYSPYGLVPPHPISFDQLSALNVHGMKPTAPVTLGMNCQEPQTTGDLKSLNGSIPCHWMGMPVGLGIGGPHSMLSNAPPFLYGSVPFHNTSPKGHQITVTSVPSSGQPNSTRRKNLYTVSTLNSSCSVPRKCPVDSTSSGHTLGQGRGYGQNYNQISARGQDKEREGQRDGPSSSSGSLSESSSSSPKRGTSPSNYEGPEEFSGECDRDGGLKSFPTAIAGEDQDAATSLIFFSQIQQKKSAEFSSTQPDANCASNNIETEDGPEIEQ